MADRSRRRNQAAAEAVRPRSPGDGTADFLLD